MLPAFKEQKRQSELCGFKPCIVVFPARPRVDAEFLEDYPQRRMQKLSAELGMPALDLLPELRKLRAKGMGAALFCDQCHPTSYASGQIAQWIYDFLAENFMAQRIAFFRQASA